MSGVTRWLELGLGLGLLCAAGATGAALAQGSPRYDGHYLGTLVLTKAIGRGDCTEPPAGAQYPMTVSGGTVRFSYAPRFDTTLIGTVDHTGNFTAMAQLKTGLVQMTGRIRHEEVRAAITSPSCDYSFQTRR
ncbi:MAG TPA: hypothetical protein VHW66_05110 [Stellaceae bacterium]|nr:hypothetical protein [Stellaceae bacterium]